MATGVFDSSIASTREVKDPNLNLLDAGLPRVGEKPFSNPIKVAGNNGGSELDFDKHRMEEIDGKKWLQNPTELANLLSDNFRHTGKLDIPDTYMLKEAMRANYKDLQGWASKLNEALKGTGTSFRVGNGVAEAEPFGNSLQYTAHIMRNGKETDSTTIGF
jgi:hypothetical protein